MPDLTEIDSLGHDLLNMTFQPIPRWRIVREVLCLPSDDPRYVAARDQVASSKWITELRETLQADGTWGRFHSRDSALSQRFPTTELALRRALSLGLDASDPVLKPTLKFLCNVLDGKSTWPDPPEKHEGWPVNIRFITAATLELLDGNNPRIAPLARIWTWIVESTFADGSYSTAAERDAHLSINDIRTPGKYLKLAGLYPLLLLSSRAAGLSEVVEKALLDWVWSKPDGIYYVYGNIVSDPPELTSAQFIDWLAALKLLMRFPYGRKLCDPLLRWLWQKRGSDGLWDFGPLARDWITLPLSENWHHPINRKIDCSVLALSMFRENLLTAISQEAGL